MAIQVDPGNVVGRDVLIEQIWAKLQKPPGQGSLRFTAERRIGKTTVMAKMAAEPKDGFDVLFLEVEGIESCHQFAALLLNRVKPLLSKTDKAKTWFDGFWGTLGGIEIGGVIKLPETNGLSWQATMEKTIEGLCNNRLDRTVVLMLDELPYMLQKINAVTLAVGSPHEALTMLDTFRVLRQRHANLRMIFAGSVGLHHVLRDLRQMKLASEPVNNMELIEIHPLEAPDALQLAKRLLCDERVRAAEGAENLIAHRLADLASNVPFYMERIVGKLGLLERDLTVEDVEATVQQQLTSDHDPWEMEHFRERLDVYYHDIVIDANGRPTPLAAIARCILDHFALADDPQSIEQVWAAVRSQMSLTDRQSVVRLLLSLGQDHYLICDSSKRYSFRFPMIKNWWKMAQGLGQ